MHKRYGVTIQIEMAQILSFLAKQCVLIKWREMERKVNGDIPGA